MDLKRSLLTRISLFALLIFIVAVAGVLAQTRAAARAHIARHGRTIQQLVADEVARSSDAYHRNIEDLDLSGLRAIGELIHFCVAIENLEARPVTGRCFSDAGEAPALLRGAMARLIGDDVIYRGGLGYYPGIKMGEMTVRPDVDSAAADAWRQIRLILAITVGILFLNFLVYRPVRRALRSTDAILAVLGRMEAGDLTARMPSFELIELNRIGRVFNLMAERLKQTVGEHQRLAGHVLSVREEERRHLARELHDELGQCLTSINAEAAYAHERARDDLPDLQPCTEAIVRLTGQMMGALQQILRALRPIGLEEFGLRVCLEQLIEGWNRRSRGRCSYRLDWDGDGAGWPDRLNVSLFRIVQESLTNATRHGAASEVTVRLTQTDATVHLEIADDGGFEAASLAEPGMGVLGMRERVQALGGRFALTPRVPRGVLVSAEIPLHGGERGAP